MNRRELFKWAALGATGLLVPSTVTYFLAPRGGWAQPLKIRIVQQYLLDAEGTGTERFRYDATWDTAQGGKQYHVDMLMRNDDFARKMLYERMCHDNGTPNSAEFYLRLPGGAYGAYL